MTLQLKNIFPGIRMGSREVKGDALIKGCAIMITKYTIVCMSW
jgi:hypothetical protein